MAKGCTICNHPKRDAIEELIKLGQSPRKIAEAFGGDFSYRTVYRHIENCLETTPAEAAYGHKYQAQEEDQLALMIPGEPGEGEERDKKPPPISAERILETIADIDADAKRMFEKALALGDFDHANVALHTRKSTQVLILDMAKIAAFGPELPQGSGARVMEDEADLPPFLEGIFEEA